MNRKVKGIKMRFCVILSYYHANAAHCAIHLLRLRFKTLISVNIFLQLGLNKGVLFISSQTINLDLSPSQ